MRLPFNRVWRKVAGYRLGYSVQRDYPGRWTTPVVVVVYMVLAVVLALMNIPLTAYDTVQEYTYTPNATIPALPFSYLIPSFLSSRLPDFLPQTLRVGDILYLNDSVETYNITSAEVDNFLFYNNPLTSCDVQFVTIQMFTHRIFMDPMRISAYISCWFPVRFDLQWESISHPGFAFDLGDMMSVCLNVSIATSCDWVTDIDGYGKLPLPVEGNVVDWTIGGEPYCTGSSHHSTSDLTDHLPCNSDPINFDGSLQGVEVVEADGTQRQIVISGSKQETAHCVYFQDLTCESTYEIAKENAFQGVYHYIRRDLGIRSPNQIWASPVVFNKTIQALPPDYGPNMVWEANEMRANTSEAVWIPWDMEHNTTVRTPKIYYSRWTYRRKSLGSAITSVFVATFTMLAAIWKIFSFVAGLVISKTDDQPSELEIELREEIASVQEELRRIMRYPTPRWRHDPLMDSTLTEMLLSSIDDYSKEGNRNRYDRVRRF